MAIGLTNSLSSIGISQYQATQSMSTGRRLNTAADGPAGMAESSSFNVQISGAAQALNNAQNASSLLNTAQGGVTQVANDLQRINTLSVQAGNSALSASNRQAIQTQINQFLQNINQTSQNAAFNGQPLLNGTQGSPAQVGPNVGNTQTVPSTNLSTASLGINGLNVASNSGQSAALSAVKQAIEAAGSAGASLGAAQTGIGVAQSVQGTAHVNASASNGALSDTNYASAASSLAQNNIQQQATTYAINMYNAVQRTSLALLP